ncbi:triose-phosphate isomerase [Buchnera aphidicola (Mollitrichosiphum nigrofasciatum)]|uniref:triose-phosphate isomerase n=1 Tax=Buchnera aphidicola TaxID=9 RepID=UPI0031B89C85
MNNNILITANWKLNGEKKTIKKFLQLLNTFLFVKLYPCKIIFSPPLIYLNLAKQLITYKNLHLAAQDVGVNSLGAFTGEISAYMLKDIGVEYVIIGHSERRLYHCENNIFIAKKFKIIKESGLIPILCIGETYEQKKNNETEKVCKEQIDIIIEYCGQYAFKNTVIAYEPIWSIGTGKLPTPYEVQKIHAFIKYYIEYKSKFIDISKITVQYGGSVDGTNIQNFLKEKDVDGVLIGGASLDFYKFSNIITLSNNL